MKEILLTVFMAGVGTLGIALIYNVHDGKQLFFSCLGGMGGWGIYLLVFHFSENVFLSTLSASVFIGIYGELCAFFLRAPTTVFLIPGCIPLIPGARLYYAIAALIRRDMADFSSQAELLVLYLLGIGIGLAFVMEMVYIIRNLLKKKQHVGD